MSDCKFYQLFDLLQLKKSDFYKQSTNELTFAQIDFGAFGKTRKLQEKFHEPATENC